MSSSALVLVEGFLLSQDFMRKRERALFESGEVVRFSSFILLSMGFGCIRIRKLPVKGLRC